MGVDGTPQIYGEGLRSENVRPSATGPLQIDRGMLSLSFRDDVDGLRVLFGERR